MIFNEIAKTSALIPLRENQYETGNPIYFSNFTSCIGIVGRRKNKNGELFGIHLIMSHESYESETNGFGENEATEVVKLITENCDINDEQGITIFGQINAWNSNPYDDNYQPIKPSYLDLIQDSLINNGFSVQVEKDIEAEGKYRAELDTITSTLNLVFLPST